MNKFNIKKIIALILLISFTNTSLSYSFYSQFIIPIHEDEANFLRHFNNTEDILSALIASDIAPQNYSRYQSEIARWKQEILDSLPYNASEELIAKQVGYYLHDRVYKNYNISSTTLKEVFEKGLFNCLSATILMMIMLRSFGIDVNSIVLPTHVYTIATLDGKKVEIENTMRDGLAISQDPSIQKQFQRLTGFSYNKNIQKTIVGWKETLGLLYSNKSYFNAKKNDYQAAFQNMMKAQVFLSDIPSEKQNLIAGYLNYSYFIYKKNNASLQEYLKTLSILEEGIQRFPEYDTLKGNYLKGVDLVLEKMIKANAKNDELQNLVSVSEPYLSPKDFQKLQKSYYVRMSLHHMRTNKNINEAEYFVKNFWENNQKDKDAQSLLQEYIHTLVTNDLNNPKRVSENNELLQIIGKFPDTLTKESLACYYSGLAKNNYNAKKFEDSVNIMEQGRQKLGNHYLIIQNGFVYAVNSAQHFINDKNYLDAIKLYKHALSFKTDRNVINNISILYEQEITKNLKNNNKQQAEQLIAESKKYAPNTPALRNYHK